VGLPRLSSAIPERGNFQRKSLRQALKIAPVDWFFIAPSAQASLAAGWDCLA